MPCDEFEVEYLDAGKAAHVEVDIARHAEIDDERVAGLDEINGSHDIACSARDHHVSISERCREIVCDLRA